MHRIISPKIKCLAIQAIQAFAIHAARHDPMVIVLFVIKIKILNEPPETPDIVSPLP